MNEEYILTKDVFDLKSETCSEMSWFVQKVADAALGAVQMAAQRATLPTGYTLTGLRGDVLPSTFGYAMGSPFSLSQPDPDDELLGEDVMVDSNLIQSFQSDLNWQLFHGIKKEDPYLPVAILVFDLKQSSQQAVVARNAWKRLKLLRHPNVLRFVDGCETEQALYIVTDPVTPLCLHLATIRKESVLFQWGMKQLLEALQFMHQGRLVHARITVNSIYVAPSGAWFLFGLEMAMPETDAALFDQYRYCLSDVKRSLPPDASFHSSLDVFQLGVLIYEMFNGPIQDLKSLLNNSNTNNKIPLPLMKLWRSLLTPAKQRPTIASIYNEYANGILSVAEQKLEQLTLTNDEALVTPLIEQLKSIPRTVALYRFMPVLLQLASNQACGAAVTRQGLGLFLQWTSHWQKENKKCQRNLLNGLLKVCERQDRAVRLALLMHLEGVSRLLTDKAVSEQWYPLIVQGLEDATPVLREATLRGVIQLAPQLTPRLLEDDLLRRLLPLQQDVTPSIRANVTIAFARIVPLLNPEKRSTLLLPALLRAMKDSFNGTRLAALKAMKATFETVSIPDAIRIVLSIIALVNDEEEQVRELVLSLLRCYIELFTSNHEKMIKEKQNNATNNTNTSTSNSNLLNSEVLNSALSVLSFKTTNNNSNNSSNNDKTLSSNNANKNLNLNSKPSQNTPLNLNSNNNNRNNLFNSSSNVSNISSNSNSSNNNTNSNNLFNNNQISSNQISSNQISNNNPSLPMNLKRASNPWNNDEILKPTILSSNSNSNNMKSNNLSMNNVWSNNEDDWGDM